MTCLASSIHPRAASGRGRSFGWLAALAAAFALFAAPVLGAENPDDYVSMHNFSTTIGGETFSSFEGMFNPNQDPTRSAMGIRSEDLPDIVYLGAQPQSVIPTRLKLYLPPGTNHFTMSMLAPAHATLVAAARLDQPPTSSPGASPTDGSPSGNYARLLAGEEVVANNGGGTVFVASPGSTQTPLDQGRWLYIRILENSNSQVYQIDFQAQTVTTTYIEWYNCAPSVFNADGSVSGAGICNPEPINLPGTASVPLGETVEIVPLEGAAASYATDDPSVASVDQSGNNAVVTGKSEGQAVITGTDHNGKTDTTTVTVDPATPLAMAATAEVERGGTITLEPSAGVALSFTTDDPDIADVNNDGVVTGTAVGLTLPVTVDITAHGYDISGEPNTATTTVTVVAPPPIQLQPDVTLGIGSTADLNNWVTQGVAVSWSPDDEGVVSVDPSTGDATGVAEGETFVTATDEEGRSDTIVVYVTDVPPIALRQNLTLSVGGTLQPGQVVEIGEADSCSSSNQNIVDPSDAYPGGLTGVGSGTATVTCYDLGGNSDTTTVTVSGTGGGGGGGGDGGGSVGGDCSFFGIPIPCAGDGGGDTGGGDGGDGGGDTGGSDGPVELPESRTINVGETVDLVELGGGLADAYSVSVDGVGPNGEIVPGTQVATVAEDGTLAGRGPGTVTVTAEDGGIVLSMELTVVVPLPPLPEPGSFHGTETVAEFFGGGTPDAGNTFVVDGEFTPEDRVDVQARIDIDPAHQGFEGELFLVAYVSLNETFYMHVPAEDGEGSTWVEWDLKKWTLEPFTARDSLPEAVVFDVFPDPDPTDEVPAGYPLTNVPVGTQVAFFVAYRKVPNGDIFFNTTPVVITVVPSEGATGDEGG